MKHRLLPTLFFFLAILLLQNINAFAFQQLPFGFPDTDREKLNINTNWDFYLEKCVAEDDKMQPPPVEFRAVNSDWEKVNLPHGLELFSNDMNGSTDDPFQKTFQRHIGWYNRSFKIDAQTHQKIFLEFEGVHQVTNLWVNGKHVGQHSIGGYTPFHFEITDFVKVGEVNTITVSADNRKNKNIPPDGDQFDFIKFGGIYRDVYLVKTNPLHLTFPWENSKAGVTITTPSVTKTNATINVTTNVINQSNEAKNCTVLTRILDANNQVVVRMEHRKKIEANQDYIFSQTGGITEQLHLWSPDAPYLYRVNTVISENGKPVDVQDNPLGIRWFEFINGEGFFLNGKNVELVGANRHQSYPFIGDAVPNSLHWKDAYQFKQAGFNMIRLAHYPHDNSFIEACDELGILLYEEPPSWIGIGEEPWFENLEEATRRMIRNHKNHPSILMWGGSLNHRGPVERLHYTCKEEDPSRPTASNGSPWTGPRGSGICDIYTPMDYQTMPIYDDEISYLCEHGSSPDASRQQFELSRSRESKNRIGVAVWTAHDYHSFKPNRYMYPRRTWSWYRVPNEPFYWYQSELLARPILHIGDERISTEGKVIVFSNCQEVILKHNGKEIARQFPDVNPETQHLLHPSFTFQYDWQDGKVEAIGLSQGVETARHFLQKNTTPAKIKLVAEMDERPFYANGSDIKMIRAYILDGNGNVVRNDQSLVSFEVTGEGSLIGENLKDANPNEAYCGVATAMIHSNLKSGRIQIKASAKGLQSDELEVSTTAVISSDEMINNAQAIFDNRKERIDIGGQGQFLQFGWQAWTSGPSDKKNIGDGNGNLLDINDDSSNNQTTNQNVFYLKKFPKASIEITANEALEWTTSWGQSSPLAYLNMDGVQVTPNDNLSLKIKTLPKGKYQLRTWHHLKEEYKKVNDSYEISIKNAPSKYKVKPTSGHYLEKRIPSSQTFQVYSNGRDEIEIKIINVNKKLPVILNGIEIEEVVGVDR